MQYNPPKMTIFVTQIYGICLLIHLTYRIFSRIHSISIISKDYSQLKPSLRPHIFVTNSLLLIREYMKKYLLMIFIKIMNKSTLDIWHSLDKKYSWRIFISYNNIKRQGLNCVYLVVYIKMQEVIETPKKTLFDVKEVLTSILSG